MNRRAALLALVLAIVAVLSTACPPPTGGGDTTTTTTTSTTSTTTSSTTTTTTLPPNAIDWFSNPTQLFQLVTVGAVFTAYCPPNGAEVAVYGSFTYTSDSSICTAAVFEGRITYASGGEVTYRIDDGQASYPGSTANGVTTRTWPTPWPWSFSFVNA